MTVADPYDPYEEIAEATAAEALRELADADRFDGECSREQVDAEKALKPRPDLLPARALLGGGKAMAYGRAKHGRCTWRVPGTEQATVECHAASAFRHLLDFLLDPNAVEAGSKLSVLYHLLAQVSIMIDLHEDPP